MSKDSNTFPEFFLLQGAEVTHIEYDSGVSPQFFFRIGNFVILEFFKDEPESSSSPVCYHYLKNLDTGKVLKLVGSLERFYQDVDLENDPILDQIDRIIQNKSDLITEDKATSVLSYIIRSDIFNNFYVVKIVINDEKKSTVERKATNEDLKEFSSNLLYFLNVLTFSLFPEESEEDETFKALSDLVKSHVSEDTLDELASNPSSFADFFSNSKLALDNFFKLDEDTISQIDIKKDLTDTLRNEFPIKPRAPKHLSVMDTKVKKKAFDPNNVTNERGLVEFTKARGNPIPYSKKLTIDLIVQPSNILNLESSKQGIAPLDREDDIIIDVISSFIIENGGVDLISNPKNIIALKQSIFPLRLTERMVSSVVTNRTRATKAQREKIRKQMEKLTSTSVYMDWKAVAFDYNKNKDLGFSNEEFEKHLKLTTKANVIDGRVNTFEVNGRKYTEYIIYDTPVFLEQAILTGQIKSIPRTALDTPDKSNSSNFNVAKKYIATIIEDAEYRIKNNKKLQSRHLCIKIDTLLENNGIFFSGKTATYRRQQRSRFLKKIESFLKELASTSMSLEGFQFLPDVPKKPKKEIVFCYINKKGEKIKSPKFSDES